MSNQLENCESRLKATSLTSVLRVLLDPVSARWTPHVTTTGHFLCDLGQAWQVDARLHRIHGSETDVYEPLV